MRRVLYLSLLLLFSALMAGCGSGGATATAQPTKTIKAVIKTSALTADQNIGGIIFSISLPTGVAPPLLPDGNADPAKTVEITTSSNSSSVYADAIYVKATSDSSAQLIVPWIELKGFSADDAITIHLTIATGTTPIVNDFRLLTFEVYSAVDVSGNGGNKIFDLNVTDGSNKITLNPTITTTIY